MNTRQDPLTKSRQFSCSSGPKLRSARVPALGEPLNCTADSDHHGSANDRGSLGQKPSICCTQDEPLPSTKPLTETPRVGVQASDTRASAWLKGNACLTSLRHRGRNNRRATCRHEHWAFGDFGQRVGVGGLLYNALVQVLSLNADLSLENPLLPGLCCVSVQGLGRGSRKYAAASLDKACTGMQRGSERSAMRKGVQRERVSRKVAYSAPYRL